MRAAAEKLKKEEIPIRENISGAALSTFRIGGNCPLIIEPRTERELITAVRICRNADLPFLPLGRGSNVLFPDAGIRYALLRTVYVQGVKHTEAGLVAACGTPLPRLASLCATLGYADLLFLCGIPGTLGGGVRMNAGAHGGELGSSILTVTALCLETLKIKTYFHNELNISYRNTIFQSKSDLILHAELALCQPADPAHAKAEITAMLARRRATQPLQMPSAGSVFRRPSPEVAMGRVLDELGLKGVRRGDAEISPLHAGFIVNRGHARAADVRALIEEVSAIVWREKGFWPQTEVLILPEEL